MLSHSILICFIPCCPSYQGVFLYWTANNVVSVAQSLVLKQDAVKKYLQIPNQPKPEDTPKFKMVNPFRSVMDVSTAPYMTVHYTTLHYTTLHYTTLHYTTLHYTTLHYTTLHYTSLHNTTLHYTTLHHTTLHYTILHYTALHYTTLHCTTLHYTTLHYTTLHHITLHYIVSKVLLDAVTASDHITPHDAHQYAHLFSLCRWLRKKLLLIEGT